MKSWNEIRKENVDMKNVCKRSRRFVKSLYVCLTSCGKILSVAFCLEILSSAAVAEIVAASDPAVGNKWNKHISDRAGDKGISKEDAAKENKARCSGT